MGLVINEEKPLGLVYNGDLIYKGKPSYEIVDFATGTDEQIAAMLEAHYDGKINISDYWHIGDTRTVHINASGKSGDYTTSHAAQDMQMVIMDFNHDDLSKSINGKNRK